MTQNIFSINAEKIHQKNLTKKSVTDCRKNWAGMWLSLPLSVSTRTTLSLPGTGPGNET